MTAAAIDYADEESGDCPEAGFSLIQVQLALPGTAEKHKGLNLKQSSHEGFRSAWQKDFADTVLEFVSGPSADALHIGNNIYSEYLEEVTGRGASEWNTNDRNTLYSVEEHNQLVQLNGTALSQIGIMTEKPLVVEFQPVQVQLDIDSPPRVNMTHPLLCHSYHKTGTEVCIEFSLSYALVTGQPFRWLPDIYGTMHDCLYSDCTHMASGRHPEVERDGPFRMLNWIREPHSLILSAFRYHMQSPESWSSKPGNCMKCDKADQEAMFGLCAERCTYTQLLTSVATVNESAGVIIEALNERGNIRNMLEMAVARANDPRVLHLSVDHLKKDFNQTMRCINTFLGGMGLGPEQLDIFQSWNPASGDHFTKDPHVTTGKYDNTVLEQFLLALPIWGEDFASWSRFFSSIFQRQTVKYGCPMP